jgi:hypothetical protein
MMVQINLVGKIFGRLTVIDGPKRRQGSRFPTRQSTPTWSYLMWLCRCECNNEKWIRGSHLKYGSVLSCGCLQTEAARRTGGCKITRSFGHTFTMSRYRGCFHGAKKRGLEFNLTFEEYQRLSRLPCFYCGALPAVPKISNRRLGTQRVRFNGIVAYNGIDRVDNQKGYVDGNIVPCCESCNRKKLNLPIDWIKSAYLALASAGYYGSD